MPNDRLPTFQFEDGRQFVPSQRIEPDLPAFESLDLPELRTLVGEMWRDSYEAKRGEIERLKTCSLYYDGFHYTNAWLNRSNAPSNYCFSTVETVHPVMTEVKPRPEIMPRRSMEKRQADALNETATWLMDTSKFDEAIHLGARDKLKFGWNMWIISFDYRTGMPYPRNLSVFDGYPDPVARNMDELEHFIIGIPVATTRLKATFPGMAEYIKPDNIASPAYDVAVRPWQQLLENSHRFDGPGNIGSVLNFTGEKWVGGVLQPPPAATGSSALSLDTGEELENGRTTFLCQLFVRDDSLMNVRYLGDEMRPDGRTGNMVVQPGAHYDNPEPCCPSGWRLISITAGGELLEQPKPLDPCYDGLPIVMDSDYKSTDRFWPTGELDHIIPIQRRLNKRNVLMMRALDLAANPPIITNKDSGIPSDHDTVGAGEMIRINRGSDVKWLEYAGPSAQQFNMYGIDQRDIDTVAGVHDVQQGQRPAGIEAASAIRRLQEAAAGRIRGKETPAHRARAELLKKLMVCMGKKLQPGITFRATNGEMMGVSPDDLLAEYDIQFIPGSGTVLGRSDFEDKAFALFDRGAIDELALLEAVNWRGREEVFRRIVERQMLMAQAQAAGEAKSSSNGSGKKNPAETRR